MSLPIKSLVIALSLTFGVATGATAQTAPAPSAPSAPATPQAVAPTPSLSPDKFAEALSHYDPDTVAAAKAYAQTFNMKSQLEKSVPQISKALAAQLKGKNPGMSDDQTKLFVDTFMHIALVDDAPVLEQATMLSMLDVFSKEELQALNQFYSSPIGAGIMKKFPQMMGRMPQIMRLMQTYIVPRALQGARDALKAQGFEVKI